MTPPTAIEEIMDPMPLEKVCDLLGQREIPGTPDQLNRLCVRIRELSEMNGEEWVRQNKETLLHQWTEMLRQGAL